MGLFLKKKGYFMITMRNLLGLCITTATFLTHADTMEHFMSIYSEIPKMEMKADPQSQAWARSARNVLAVTSETIAETLLHANEIATSQGKPLFCLPISVQLNSNTMNDIIIRAYESNSSQNSDKSKMTVSQIAWLGITKFYPCQQQQSPFEHQASPFNGLPGAAKSNTMQHVSGDNHQ